MGVLIVLVLGFAAGLGFHVRLRSFIVASVLGTVTGACLWMGGTLVLFRITAPNELKGGLLLWAVLLIFATAAVGAVMAGSVVRACRTEPEGLCQGCGYDLTGNTSGVCPECGTAISKAS